MNFFKSLRYLSEFYAKAGIMTYPSITINFPTLREEAYFRRQLKLDWPREMLPTKKPRLRNVNGIDWRAAIIGATQRIIEDTPYFPYRNCINCMNFDRQKELCKLCNMRPPAEVIAYGCSKHEDIEVPF